MMNYARTLTSTATVIPIDAAKDHLWVTHDDEDTLIGGFTGSRFQHGGITLVLLPPYAPELNPIENVWAYLRANRLAVSVFETYQEIDTQCCDAWNFFANDIEAVKSITARDYAKTVKG